MDSSVRTRKNNLLLQPRGSVLTPAYWREAAKQVGDIRMLVFAALIIALRVAVKALKTPIIGGVSFSFDCYVNSLGSMIYGPVVALLVGAISDTIGVLLFPSNDPYFLPFILVEMSSSFLFALFLWRKPITAPRVLASKFTVNFICNIIMTSLFYKWSVYVFSGPAAAEASKLITLVRIVKNLILFPLEAMLIVMILSAFIPALKHFRIVPADQGKVVLKLKHIILIISLTILSVGLVLLYIFFLKDFLAGHNIKFF